MYRFFKSIGLKNFLLVEALPLGISLFITELLFKFGSFTLEALAFLATWFFLSWLGHLLQADTPHNRQDR